MHQLNPAFETDSFLRQLIEMSTFESPARLFGTYYLYREVAGLLS